MYEKCVLVSFCCALSVVFVQKIAFLPNIFGVFKEYFIPLPAISARIRINH